MKLKYLIVIIFVLLFSIFIIDNSYAIDEENINNITDSQVEISLEYKNNIIEQKEKIYDFIDLIDNSLIPTASFSISSILNDN